MKRPPPEICPHCGTDVPRNALACPECGSDYETGWSDDADAQRLGLPDEKFDYDEFVKEEFGPEQHPGQRKMGMLWWIAAIVLFIALLFFFLQP